MVPMNDIYYQKMWHNNRNWIALLWNNDVSKKCDTKGWGAMWELPRSASGPRQPYHHQIGRGTSRRGSTITPNNRRADDSRCSSRVRCGCLPRGHHRHQTTEPHIVFIQDDVIKGILNSPFLLFRCGDIILTLVLLKWQWTHEEITTMDILK